MSSVNGSTGTITGIATTANPTLTGVVQLGTAATLAFEGATSNAFDTTITVVDPTANRTITLPDASGTVAFTSNTVASFNGVTGAVTGVASFNGSTGTVTGVSSVNAATGAITGLATTAATVASFNGVTGAVTGVSSVNGSTGAITGIATTAATVASFNGLTGAVTGVASYNGSTGAVTGVSSVNAATGAITGIATTAGNLSQFAATTSAQLLGIMSDETGTGLLTFATAPTISKPLIDNPLLGYTTTTSSATAIVLTATSNYQQYITGSTAQTITLPVASTMTLGQSFKIVNNNTAGSLTINSSGGNLVLTVPIGFNAEVLCILASGTTAASWSASFCDFDSITGTGSVVLSTSPTLTTPALGTPSAIVLTSGTGLPISTGVSGLGTGIATALAVNTGSAGAPVLFNGALGTPTSGTLTNATGLPIAGLVASTSTALGVGSVELGNATDTTLSRSSAGVLAVEGVVVDTISATNTLTNKTLTTPKITLTYAAKTAAYTFVTGDEGNIFSMNNAASVQFNIPTDATFNFAIGTEIHFVWITGAGQPTIGATTPATTTILSTGATAVTPKLRVVNSAATAIKLAANSWLVVGDLA